MVASITRGARSIPTVTSGNQVQVLQAIKAVLDAYAGQTDPLARVVQVGDFKGGVLDLGSISGGSTGGGGGTVIVPGGGGGYDPTTDLTTPPAPTGLQAIGGYETIQLIWDAPDVGYRNPSLTEVWSSDTDVIGNAQLVGRATYNMFVDRAGHNQSKYYWIRFVSAANVTGPWNGTPGTFAQTALDVASVLAALAGQISESELTSSLGARIDLVDGIGVGSVNERIDAASQSLSTQISTVSTTVDGNTATLQTQATSINGIQAKYTVKIDNNGYVAGYGLISEPNNGNIQSSFAVRADRFSISSPTGPGIAPITPFVVQTTQTTINGIVVPPGVYINAAYILTGTIARAAIGLGVIDDARIANLSAAKLTAGDGTIGGLLKSSNYAASVRGWAINPDGSAEFNTGVFRGQLAAASGRFAGYVTGGAFSAWAWPTTGGGFYLGPEGLLMGNYNDWVGGRGGGFVQLQTDGNLSTPQFSITNGAATFSGSITGASGTFGTITSGLLRNAANTAALNLNATGTTNFLRGGAFLNYGYYGNHYRIEINADGSGFMERGILSPPQPLIFNSNYTIQNDGTMIDSGLQTWTPSNTNHPVYMGEFSIDTTLNDPAGWTTGSQAADVYAARVYALSTQAVAGNSSNLPLNTALFRIIIQATPSWSAVEYKTGSTSFPEPAGPSGRIYLICRVWCINAYYGNYPSEIWQYAVRLNSVAWEVYRA